VEGASYHLKILTPGPQPRRTAIFVTATVTKALLYVCGTMDLSTINVEVPWGSGAEITPVNYSYS
jgi:hypothetical protein